MILGSVVLDLVSAESGGTQEKQRARGEGRGVNPTRHSMFSSSGARAR